MKVILFGATGMVGQGVLREYLRNGGIEGVLVIGRSPTGRSHPNFSTNLFPLTLNAVRARQLKANVRQPECARR